jgi:dolichol-phosphate mannosyltransferase
MFDVRSPSVRRELTYFVKFGAVGASGMVIDLVCFVSALMLFPAAVARALAIWVAMTWNFAGNRTLTFADRSGDFFSQYVAYCLGCLVGATVNWGVSLALWSLVPALRQWPWVPALAGVASGMMFNYVLCRRLVFRTRAETNTPQSQRRAA